MNDSSNTTNQIKKTRGDYATAEARAAKVAKRSADDALSSKKTRGDYATAEGRAAKVAKRSMEAAALSSQKPRGDYATAEARAAKVAKRSADDATAGVSNDERRGTGNKWVIRIYHF